MAAKKQWSEGSRRSRKLIVAAGVVEVVLLAATLIDIKRRPAGQIKGSKRMWTALASINILGPIAHFAFGRRRSASVWPVSAALRPASVFSAASICMPGIHVAVRESLGGDALAVVGGCTILARTHGDGGSDEGGASEG